MRYALPPYRAIWLAAAVVGVVYAVCSILLA
jgi:hypothetical protein